MKPLIKVGGFECSSYITKCFEYYPEKCSDPGVIVTVLYNQLLSCGFQIQFVNTVNISTAYKMLAKGDLDLVAMAEDSKTISLNSDFDVTSPMFEDHSVLYMDDSKTKRFTPNLLLYMCPWSVWLFVSVTLIIALLYKYLCQATLRWLLLKKVYKTDFIEQLPLIFWSLAFGIFCEFFQTALSISLASTVSPNIPFSNTQTFLKSLQTHRCEMVLLKEQQNFWPLFFQTKGALFDEFRRMLENKHVIIAENETEGVKVIRESDCNLGLTTSTDFILMQAKYGKLKMVKLKELPKNRYVVMFRKDSIYKQKFGLINTFGSANDQYYQAVLKTAENFKKMNPLNNISDKKKYTSLTLGHLYSGFLVLLVGLIIGSITFFFKLFYNYMYTLFNAKRSSFKVKICI